MTVESEVVELNLRAAFLLEFHDDLHVFDPLCLREERLANPQQG